MSLANWIITVLVAAYVAAVVGTVYFLRWRRKTRWPFKEEDKLLRGPGEELRRRIAASDESFIFEFLGGTFAAMIVFPGSVALIHRFSPETPGRTMSFAAAITLVVIVISCWRIGALWSRRANDFLGWFGERYVAEWLEPAKLRGWRVFHDVPFRSDGQHFNIDHVAVGPGGVLAFETKTRRKGTGEGDHKVSFNGRELKWPWGESTEELEQAERNALTLAQWIKTEIGERVHVTPYLVLPGWWLTLALNGESRLCRVANPKWIPAHLEKERPILSPKLVDLIALRLEAKCRDVAG